MNVFPERLNGILNNQTYRWFIFSIYYKLPCILYSKTSATSSRTYVISATRLV